MIDDDLEEVVRAQLEAGALREEIDPATVSRALLQTENPEQILQTAYRWLDEGAEHIVKGDLSSLGLWITTLVFLSDVAARSENATNLQLMSAQLTWARQRTLVLNLPGARAWIELAQAMVSQGRGDLASAAAYARSAHASAVTATASGQDLLPPGSAHLGGLLTQITNALYYKAQDYKQAAELASLAVQTAGDIADAYFFLGNALARIPGRESEAEEIWRQYAEKWPERPVGHANLGAAMQDRPAEALRHISRAIELAPDNSMYVYNRGVFRLDHDPEGAIEDLRRAVRLATAEQEKDTEDRRAENVAINAIVQLMALTQSEGPGGIEEEIRTLKSSSDKGFRSMGYILAARFLAASAEKAIAELDEALVIDPDDAAGRTLKIQIRLDAGEIELAQNDFRYLGRRDHDPDGLVEILNPLLEKDPDHVLARKWRGYGYQQRLRANAAKADFAVALQALPDDAELSFWDAMADLTFVPTDEELDPFTVRIDFPKAFGALQRIARASARLEDPEPARVYRWFADRFAMAGRLLEVLAFTGQDEGGWYSVSPSVKAAYRLYHESGVLNEQRDWKEAGAKLTAASGIFFAEGYPCLGSKMALYAADAYLRSWELEKARASLDVAAGLEQSIVQPLNDFSRIIEKRDESPRPTFKFELELMPVYGIGYDGGLGRKIIQADLERRLGALDEAIATLGDSRELIKLFEQGAFREQSTFRGLFTAFTVYRDARRYDDAQAVADAAEPFADNPYDRATLENGRGGLLLLRDDYAAAEAAVKRALELFPSGAPSMPARLMLSRILYDQGRLAEAQEIVSAVQPEELSTAAERLGHAHLGALISLALDHHRQAAHELARMLAIIEEQRAQLELRDRTSWQNRFEQVLRLGVTLAIARGDVSTAFDSVQRSRGRSLLDEIESDAASTPEIAALLTQREGFEMRGLALDALLADNSGAADLDLIRTAAPNAEARKTLQSEGSGLLDREAAQKMAEDVRLSIAALEQQISTAEYGGGRFRDVSPLGFEELRSMLAAGANGRPVTLVEYFLDSSGASAVFIVSANADVPRVVPIDVDVADLQAEVRAWTLEVRRPDSAPATPEVFQKLLVPIVESVSPGDVLWIVPDPILANVPLHAAEIDGMPLIDRHPIVYTPTASIMRSCRQVRARRLTRSVVVGDPLGDLEFAREEARAIARRMSVQPVVGAAATRERVVDAIEHARDLLDLLHLATHGWFSVTHPMLSGVVLAPDPGSIETEDVLTADEFRRLALDVALIVVSGCETGKSRVNPGAEMTGLTRGLLIAGARSVLVSLWNVADISTTFLMSRLYDTLLAHDPPPLAVALAEVQQWLRSLTLRTVIDALAEWAAQAEDDLFRLTLLRSTSAWMHNLAGNRAEALAICEDLARRSSEADSPATVARLRKRVGEVARAIRETQPRGDYGFAPFGAPYFWAPFILVGSWD